MSTRRDPWLWIALGTALLLRLQAFLRPLMPDESGFVLVARQWDPRPDNMYGDLWVDRPPLLIGLIRVADDLGGTHGPRVAAAAFVLLCVLAAYRCGLALGGPVAARWTGLAAAALSGQPDVTAFSAKSETFGVPLVLTSCWLVLEASRAERLRARAVLAFAAGTVGSLALGMKQNLVGAAVFGLVLLTASVVAGELRRAEAARLAGWGALGFALPVLGVVVWALTQGVELGSVWYMLYGFRTDAWDVIMGGPIRPTLGRAVDLVVLSVVSGMTVVLLWFLLRIRDALRAHAAVTAAVVVMVLVDGVSLVLSGSYWGSNLTALFPGTLLALGVVLSSPRTTAAVGMKVLAAAAVVSTAVTTAAWTVTLLRGGHSSANYLGQRLGQVSQPGDSVVVLYGAANVVLASGLATPYEHLWSLPARTVDPGLRELTRVMSGPEAPTWVVSWLSPNAWGIDREGTVRQVLAERYTRAGRLCGKNVFVRRDLQRPALGRIDCRKPWLG